MEFLATMGEKFYFMFMWSWPLIAVMVPFILFCRMSFSMALGLKGYSYKREAVVNDNPAISIRLGCLLIAAIVAFFGVVHPSAISWQEDVSIIIKYSLLIMAALFVSQAVNNKLILYDFENDNEVIGEKNIAVAMVEGSTYLATALILSGALSGWNGGFWVSVIWFVTGQFLLVGLALLFRAVYRGTGQAIDTHNHACALALAGFLLSSGVVLRSALSGSFTDWTTELTQVIVYMLMWVIYMTVIHLAVNYIAFWGHPLHVEIMTDGNAGAGFIHFGVSLAASIVYVMFLG